MAFIADEQMVQTFAANAADESFTYGIGTRGTKRRFDDINLGASDRCGKVLTVFLVIIADEVLGAFSERGGFSQLLGDPFVCWVTGHADMDDPARAQLDDHKREQPANPHVGDLNEVARPDILSVIVQERLPGLARRAWWSDLIDCSSVLSWLLYGRPC